MASTRIHIDEARLGRVQKQDRIATGVLTAIVAIVMLIVVSMVAYILFEGISTLFQPIPISTIYPQMVAVALGLGVGVGFVVSFVTIRKSLRV